MPTIEININLLLSFYEALIVFLSLPLINLFWYQDKNRDVIVAFPDVEPFVIQTTGLYTSANNMYSTMHSKHYEVKDASSDAYEHPHLWYDTSVVMHALELFLRYGDEVSDSNTFR